MPPVAKPWHQRFNVDPESGCWLWNMWIEDNGYGRVWYQGRNVGAHRLMYEVFVGPIPEEMEIDHLCRNKACVNPAHLEPVTTAENQRRGDARKLTWEDAHFIRANYVPRHSEYGIRAMARRLGVCPEAIHKIVKNRAWVDDPALTGRT